MDKWQEEVKTSFVAEFDRLAEELHFEAAERGEDEVLATAVVAGLTQQGSVESTGLIVVGRDPGITIEARNVCFAGSRGALANRAVSYMMEHIFISRNEDDSPSRDQLELCGVLSDSFRSSNRTPDDLVAMIVAASNDVTLRTSAAVDFSDGEVVVSEFVPCDTNKVPADLKSAAKRVLQHAYLIQRTMRIIRDLMTPDVLPTPRTMAKLFDKLCSNKQTERVEYPQQGAIEEVLL